MVALEFNALNYTLILLASMLVPGLAIGIPLLRKSGLSKLETLMLCLFIGMVVPPALLVLESIVGIGFSLFLVFLNIFILTAAGLMLGIRQNAFSFKMPSISDDIFSFGFVLKHATTVLLLIAIVLAFWLRIQTYTPIYSELDPYFYVYGSGEIIRFGDIPQGEDTAWWPEVKASHRNFPQLKMFMEAQWYSLYTGGGEYGNYLMFVTSSWLPPISAALMSFGAYLLFSSYFGKRYGVLGAFLLAFMPITIFKMAAGVNEAAPFGMMSIFLVLGLYALALKRGDLRIAMLSGLAMFSCVLMSSYSPTIVMPFALFVVLQSLEYFVRGRADTQNFTVASAFMAGGLILATAIYNLYSGGVMHMLNIVYSSPVLLSFLAVAFAYAVQNYSHLIKKENRKIIVAAVVLAGVFALLIPNPLGTFMKSQISTYIGAAGFNVPLERTIAEQNLAGGSFENEAGFLAIIPKNHVSASPADLRGNVENATYSSLGVVSGVSSFFGNLALKSSSAVFNAFLGTRISSGDKDPSLLFFFLIVSTSGFIIDYLSRFMKEGKGESEPSLPLLLFLFMFPIAYIGLIKIKFSVFMGIALTIAAVCTIAYLERIASLCLKAMSAKAAWQGRLRFGAYAACALLIVAQIWVPSGFSMMILSKSFDVRYQDAPAASMPKLAETCALLKDKGYDDPEICAAGSDIKFSDTINNQFNGKVCLVSQLSAEELFPAADTASQQRSGEAKAGASYRCNRLADYWVDSMEWISKNVPEDGRVTSWWDYGHWINYFGDRKTVLRNEHASKGMIGRVAHDYLIGGTQDLVDSMNYFDSQYVLFDVELIGSTTFGGKYGALNYLGCAHEGETSVLNAPGTSDCEFNHNPERLIVPKISSPSNVCIISESQQRTGVVAYRLGKNGVDQSKPAYCVGETTVSTGEKITATYYADRKDANGDLLLSKGFMRKIEEAQDSYVVEMIYNNQPVWPDGKGGFVGGMEDAMCIPLPDGTRQSTCSGGSLKSMFYNSNLYAGVFLEKLPGFELVYRSKRTQ